MPMFLSVYSNGPFTQWAGLVYSTKYQLYELDSAARHILRFGPEGLLISHLFVVKIRITHRRNPRAHDELLFYFKTSPSYQ